MSHQTDLRGKLQQAKNGIQNAVVSLESSLSCLGILTCGAVLGFVGQSGTSKTLTVSGAWEDRVKEQSNRWGVESR